MHPETPTSPALAAAENDRSPVRKRLGSVLSVVVSLTLIGLAFYIFTHDMQAIRSFVSANGAWGLAAALVVFTLLGATVIPSEPLTLLILTIYGPLVAAITSAVGNLGSALVEYFLGTRLGHAAGFIQRKEHLPWGLGKLPMTSPALLILGRMLPGYGAKLIGLLSGMYRVPLLLYIWTTAIQTTLGAVVFSYGGYGILSLFQR
jgi:uncharacterized membrane protein YdjX (TVP38/TMEM64 family)